MGLVLLGLLALAWSVAVPDPGAAATTDPPPVGSLTVHVTDQGSPVDGASVGVDVFVPDTDLVWFSTYGTTGPDGSVVIVMPPGDYEVSARDDVTGRYASVRGFLAPESSAEVTLALQPASAYGTVVVEVLDELSAPRSGIQAGVGESFPPLAFGETGIDGRAVLPDVPPGDHVIGIFSPEAGEMLWGAAAVVAGEAVTVRFVLLDGGVLATPPGPPGSLQAVGGQGTIDLSWAPPAGGVLPVTAHVVLLDGTPVASVAEGATGHRPEGVSSGAHEVGVAAVDLSGQGAPAMAPVTVAEPTAADDVTFEVALDGVPVLGATVALVSTEGLVDHGATDAQGRVTFTDVPVGGYEVWASAPGWDLGDGTTRWLVHPGFEWQTDTALPTELTNSLRGRRLYIPHAIAVDAVPIDLRWQSDVAGDHPWFDHIRAAVNAGIARGPLFQPAAPMSRQAVAAWLARRDDAPLEPCAAAPFSDVPADHPFCPEISWLAASGATEGYGDGTFRPAAPVSRQGAAAFLWRLAGEPPVGPAPPTFSDVGADHPFREAIEWMAASGRSTGWGDGTFRPGVDVSRQAMAVFLYPDLRPGALDPNDVPAP